MIKFTRRDMLESKCTVVSRENSRKASIALWLFVGLVLGLSISYWVAFNLARMANLELSKDVFGALRGFGPTVAAMVALTYLLGRGSIRSLWAGLVQWRVSGQLYGIALLAPLAAMSLALLITYFIHPDVFAPGDINVVKLVAIFFILPILDGPIGEEIGWRGFFLPLLMQRYNAILASLIVASVWFLWHLPHYHVDGMEMSGLILPKYLLYTFALSLIHTWLFSRAQGSVLIHVIFHNMANYVVLLAFTLFPAVASVALGETSYFVAMLTLGTLAGLSIWRQPCPEEAPGNHQGTAG